MGSPRTRKGTATRQRLLDTAVKLFASTGYDAVTMRAIAREAGVSTGLAYRYFDGKEALVAELYARLAQAFVEGVALPDGSWSDRGLHALDTSLRVLAPHRDALAALMGAAAAKPGLSFFVVSDSMTPSNSMGLPNCTFDHEVSCPRHSSSPGSPPASASRATPSWPPARSPGRPRSSDSGAPLPRPSTA